MKSEDVRDFFYDRLTEAFHKDTIDSHRVRCHNALTLIQESIEIISGWANTNVKIFETVKLCIDETIAAINADACLLYTNCSKQILVNTLCDYSKSGKDDNSLAKKVLYILNEVERENSQIFLNNIFSKISSILLKESWEENDNEMIVFSEIDSLITAFATQLIHNGFSKIYLYKLIQRIKADTTHSFESQVRYIGNLLCKNKVSETVTIMKVPINGQNKWTFPLLSLWESIPDDLISDKVRDGNQAFLRPTKASRYYVHHSNSAKDSVSAVKETREEISRILDIINMGDSSVYIPIPNTALVVSKNSNGSEYCEMAVEYILDGGYRTSETEIKNLIAKIETIRSSKRLTNDVVERIDSALRHLRIGNSQPELEQRFINYWIALEFIFASPEAKESTFTRLKSNLMNLLTSCYIKRNVIDLNRQLIRDGKIKKDQKIWLFKDVDFDELILKESNSLLRYRMRKMKAVILDKNKRKALFMTHENNLNFHLARLYRLRNELIHEAAIKQDIESVTSNLRYYLVFLLNQVVGFYSNLSEIPDMPLMALDNFFCYYDLLQRRIKEEYNLEIIMDVPCESAV